MSLRQFFSARRTSHAPRCIVFLLLFLFTAILSFGEAATPAAMTPVVPGGVDGSADTKIVESYGKLPLSFEANRGQTDSRVQFISRGQGYTLFLTSREAVLSLKHLNGPEPVGDPARRTVVRMQLVRGNRQPAITQEGELAGKSNYFVGNDPAKWHTNVPNYAKVRYRGVYPGVDLVYYGNQRQLEHDFVVAPGADPGRIRFRLRGVNKLRLDRGDLVMQTAQGELRLQKPEIYQMVDGERRTVAGGYLLKGATAWDSSLPTTTGVSRW